MIPHDIPAGTPIVHTTRDGHRRAGHTTGPARQDAARIWTVPIKLNDGTHHQPVIDYPDCTIQIAAGADLDPPQLALFTLEQP